MVFSMSSDYGEWTTWVDNCDVTCGYGTNIKTRTCEEIPGYPVPDYCKVQCPGDETSTMPCDRGCCDCKNSLLK